LLKIRNGSFLVAFSSVNTLLGGFSTGSYSAANAYMEAYCRRLFRSGYPAVCYSWSLWEGIGMSGKSTITKSAAGAQGLHPLSVEDGLHSLFAALHSGQSEAIIGLDSTRAPIQALLVNDRFARQTVVGFIEHAEADARYPVARALTLHDRFDTPIQCRIEPLAAFPLTDSGTTDRIQLASIASGRQARSEPENEVESALIDIWRNLLQVTDVGTQDSFFELGGDSLRAIQLVTRIDAVLNVKLAVSSVFHAPTIRQLARACAKDEWQSKYFSVVPIREIGSGKPLFIVQSVGQDLIQHLDPDKPVYAFNYGVGAEKPDEMLNLPPRLEDLASHYIGEMLSIQPIGPFSIIGHSAAGLVAFEMARQLTSIGHCMDLVALIDTHYLPVKAHPFGGVTQDKLKRLLKSPRMRLARMSENWFRHRLRNINYKYFSKRTEIPIAIRARHLFNEYVPKSYNGTLTYIKCTRHSRFEPVRNDEVRWKELAAGGFELHTIPCQHYEIMKNPYVEMLAKIIMKSTE
jgi:thioesterase domain-containing protein/acyl carrier protein